MSLASPFDWGGGEIILVLALLLILLGARKLSELAKGLSQGIDEFRKAAGQVVDKISHHVDGERRDVQPSHPLLMTVTFILGSVCLALVSYELSK